MNKPHLKVIKFQTHTIKYPVVLTPVEKEDIASLLMLRLNDQTFLSNMVFVTQNIWWLNEQTLDKVSAQNAFCVLLLEIINVTSFWYLVAFSCLYKPCWQMGGETIKHLFVRENVGWKCLIYSVNMGKHLSGNMREADKQWNMTVLNWTWCWTKVFNCLLGS